MTSSQFRADVAATSTQHHSASTQQPRSGNHTLIPVYVLPENLCRVQQFVLSLGQPIFSAPTADYCPSLHTQVEVNAPNSPTNNSYEQRSDFQELISGISTLSVSTPSSYVPSTPLVSSSHHPTSVFGPSSSIPSISNIPLCASPSPTKGNRYYAVVVGKKTGVFWDKWANVEPLVKNVSGSRHKSFSTNREALAFYLEAKMQGDVQVIRNPGDDLIYGPVSEAMQ